MAVSFHQSRAPRRSGNATQVPIVCSSCTLVHRVTPSALTSPTVLCPSCGHARDTKALLANLPTVLVPRGKDATSARV